MKKTPFRLTPYQVQFLLVVGFVTVGYALYLRYLAIEYSPVALACDAGLQIDAVQGRVRWRHRCSRIRCSASSP